MHREESETLEFKLRVDSQRKIAKTLVALANGQGGRIVVGVRDSGSVAGCNLEEEFYMIQGAAHRHTRPEVAFTASEARWDGKPVLVVDISASDLAPHAAEDEHEGIWTVYVRRGAANYRANRVLLESIRARFQDVEASSEQLSLLSLIPDDVSVSASSLARASKLPIRDVEDGLAVLLRWEQVGAEPMEQGWRYRKIY